MKINSQSSDTLETNLKWQIITQIGRFIFDRIYYELDNDKFKMSDPMVDEFGYRVSIYCWTINRLYGILERK